jgi:hypothetical protein
VKIAFKVREESILIVQVLMSERESKFHNEKNEKWKELLSADYFTCLLQKLPDAALEMTALLSIRSSHIFRVLIDIHI